MRAGWYESNGPAQAVIKIGEMADPEPGAGEVRVRIHRSGINPSDVKRRDGWGGQRIEFPRVIPHSDGAGIIDKVGNGVSEKRVGERVWTYNAQWKRPFGTAAEYIVLPEAQAPPLPSEASMEFGACLGIPALTAHRALFADGPVDGKTVLVTGGAGAVGNYAVQMASWDGARAIATVSSEAKADAARAAGAEAVIDYKTENVTERVMALTDGAGVDRIVDVDLGANLETSAAVIKQNGTIALYASMRAPEPKFPVYHFMRKNALIRNVFVYEMPTAAFDAGIADIARWLQNRRARANVAATFPLARLAEAHEAVESGTVIGNVVVEVAEP
jgi:NADPH2:quinone reductase